MLFPSKLINFNESIFPKLSKLLILIQKENTNILTLYKNSKKFFSNLEDFISALELLYVLDKIEYDEFGRVIKYVEND